VTRHLKNASGLLPLILALMSAPVAAQQLDATEDLMKRLTEAPGPSAFEEEVRQIVAAEFGTLGADIEYDGLGSVHAVLEGNVDGPTVMVTAHLDESRTWAAFSARHIRTSDGPF
jgi:endoglucanase